MANLTAEQLALFEEMSALLETVFAGGETETTTDCQLLEGYNNLTADKKEGIKNVFRMVLYVLLKGTANNVKFNVLRGTQGIDGSFSNGTKTLHFTNGILTSITTP